MQRKDFTITDANGTALSGISITVVTFPGLAVPTLYQADGATPYLSNVLTTNASGYAYFFAANGSYQVTISGAGISTVVVSDFVLFDPKDDSPTVKYFGAVADGVTNDAPAIISALAARDYVVVPAQGTIDPATGQVIYRVDSEIQVTDDKKLVIEKGAILRRISAYSAATTPVVTGLGFGWEISGGGRIESQNASPSGVVRLGHLDSSDNRNAWWWRFQDLTVLGRAAVAAGDIGVYVPSGQVTNPTKANFFGAIHNINLQYADLGLYLDEMANAHSVSNIRYWSCRTANLRIRGAYANTICNQFMHAGFADGVIGIDLRNKSAGSQDPLANNIIGFVVETTGANDVPVFLDTAAAHNIIVGAGNVALGPTNNATGANTLILSMTGARMEPQGPMNLRNKLYPGTDALAKQTAAAIFAGTGIPNNANGDNGDFYFRGDGTAAGNTVVYHKEAGSWVALTT